MNDYPYSQQIHDKILNDWKDVPLKEWVYNENAISFPTIDYGLFLVDGALYPSNENLMRALRFSHGKNLYMKLYFEPKEKMEKEETEQAAKKFLGLK